MARMQLFDADSWLAKRLSQGQSRTNASSVFVRLSNVPMVRSQVLDDGRWLLLQGMSQYRTFVNKYCACTLLILSKFAWQEATVRHGSWLRAKSVSQCQTIVNRYYTLPLFGFQKHGWPKGSCLVLVLAGWWPIARAANERSKKE